MTTQGQEPQGVVNLDALGRQLSLTTDCVIQYNQNKHVFVCKCGVEFPVGELIESNGWVWAKEKHGREGR